MPTTIAKRSRSGHRVQLPRPSAAGHARQPAPAGRRRRPAGSTSSCSAGTGRRSGWSSPSPATARSHAEIPLDPLSNRTGDHWHVRVDGLPEEFCYGYRVDGPKDNGHRYDPTIILLDPARGPSRAAGPGATGGSLPRRSLMTESMIDRRRVGQSAHAAGRHDHLRAARARLHDRPELRASASRDLSRAWPRRSTT